MGDSDINFNERAINYLKKSKNQRKVSFLNETLPYAVLVKQPEVILGVKVANVS